MVSAYLESNYDRFFASYTALVLSKNYVTKRQSLKLLGEILLDRANFNVMTRCVNILRGIVLNHGSDTLRQIHCQRSQSEDDDEHA